MAGRTPLRVATTPTTIPRSDAATVAVPESSPPESPKAMSIWIYAVGPVALVMVAIMRHFKLVADVPLWAYAAATVGSAIVNKQTERWAGLQRGTWRLHVRVFRCRVRTWGV